MVMIETITLREAARILKCHEQTVRKLVHEGKLHGRKFGRSWAFLASDIEKLFRQCDNENRLPVPEREKSWHFTNEARFLRSNQIHLKSYSYLMFLFGIYAKTT